MKRIQRKKNRIYNPFMFSSGAWKVSEAHSCDDPGRYCGTQTLSSAEIPVCSDDSDGCSYVCLQGQEGLGGRCRSHLRMGGSFTCEYFVLFRQYIDLNFCIIKTMTQLHWQSLYLKYSLSSLNYPHMKPCSYNEMLLTWNLCLVCNQYFIHSY